MSEILFLLFPADRGTHACTSLKKGSTYSSFKLVSDHCKRDIRDQSLIMGRGGGGYKIGKLWFGNFLLPPPPPPSQERVKPFVPPIVKGGTFLRPQIQYG